MTHDTRDDQTLGALVAAGPPKPELAMDGLREDIATVKGHHHD